MVDKKLLNFGDFEELIQQLDEKYENLMLKTDEAEELYWEIEKKGFDANIISDIGNLMDSVYNEAYPMFEIEKIIFEEMSKILPEQSSIDALKSENEKILLLHEAIKNKLNQPGIQKEKDIIQAELIELADLIRRNAHKKENIFFPETLEMLPKQSAEQIVSSIK